MVFAGDLIHEAGDRGVRNLHPRLGEGVRGPDIGERPAASIDPQTGVLRVPWAMRIGIGTVGSVVGVHARAVRVVGAVAAQKADVAHARVLARAPEKGGGAGVETAGEDPEASEDAGS